MNPNAEKWVAALESGEFKQGKRQLKTEDNRYCCLGVACEIARREGVISYYDGAAGGLDIGVKDWLGLSGALGSYYLHNEDSLKLEYLNGNGLRLEYLSDDNDVNEKTFTEIAAIIRSEPKGLFVDGNHE